MMVTFGLLSYVTRAQKITTSDCACINCDMLYMDCMMIQD